jgi:small-conductance mechanosensitive channel/CRP-like cAMP-binding protein
MPTTDLIVDSTLFVAAGLVLALATIWLRRDMRAGTARMVLVMLIGLGGLALLERFGPGPAEGPIGAILRELALVILAIGVARVTVTFAFRVVLGKIAVPQILTDVLMALVLLVFAFWRMTAVGVNLAGIVTTSAVVTGVLAFSLQETLGNLWGGIQLQLDNTCRLGDWIRVDTVMGQVVGIRWRYVAIATNNGETVIMPNGMLSKSRVVVLARRGDQRIPWRREVEFGVSYDTPPSRVIAVVDAALVRAEIPNVAASPRLDVLCTHFADNSFQYVVRYWLTDLVQDYWTDSQVRLHIAATLVRHRMEIPYPHRVLLRPKPQDAPHVREFAARNAALARIDLFVPLTDSERHALAADLADCPYVAHDVIARQGEPAESLFILAHGRVAVFDDGAGGTGVRNRLATLEAPAYFGEMGLLTGQARGATIVAEDEVLCYRLDKAGFDAIVKARPELIDALSQVVAKRQAANDATLQTLSADARARQAVGGRAELVRRMKRFFAIT